MQRTLSCKLNDGSPTHIDIRSGKESAIDLTLCSSDIAADLQWSTIKDPHQSDHYPINIKQNIPITEPLPTRFIFKKAHWENFRTECEVKLNNTKNIKIEEFTETLLTIAENHIPKTSPKPRKNKPWFNEECKSAIKTKNKALKKFLSHPTEENLRNFKMTRAKARRTIRESKRNSFKSYASKINNSTPISKVFKMIKKMKGTHSEPIKHILKENSFAETEKTVANEIASAFSKNSSSDNYKKEFKIYKQISEKKTAKLYLI